MSDVLTVVLPKSSFLYPEGTVKRFVAGIARQIPAEEATLLIGKSICIELINAPAKISIDWAASYLLDESGEMCLVTPSFESPRFPRKAALLSILKYIVTEKGAYDAASTDLIALYYRLLAGRPVVASAPAVAVIDEATAETPAQIESPAPFVPEVATSIDTPSQDG